ncbi:MAG: glycosyltransferase family 4 protein [Chloroflexi bacterium]|uniref:glycosyltransferase family 4 protein n=1 Tax=Candidatus Flexifilum breve TaxID=3140694 RepID=UPI003134F061|nr:glycosyltransferase family 4 protein [Chloroflexota bacterium]
MASEKRCLLVITGAFDLDGGIAASSRLAIYALCAAGYAIDIFAFNESADSAARYAALPSVRYWGANNHKAAFTVAVLRAVLTRRYAFAFSDHINVASILAPLALLGMIHYVVRVHLIEAIAPYLDMQGKLGLRFASRIQASEFARSEVLKTFPKLQIDPVALSLPPDVNFALTETWSNPAIELQSVDGQNRALDGRMILLVGRMTAAEQYKGQDVLIQAMPLILERCPAAQLVLAGQGDDFPRLLSLAQTQPGEISARIFMPGFVSREQLDVLYQTCIVFAMPSRGEGFGVVFLEAMRWAKPCLGSRLDAAQYLIVHEQTGLLVDDPQSPREVADALLRILNDPQLARAYGQKGYELVQQNYRFDRFRERFLQSLSMAEP